MIVRILSRGTSFKGLGAYLTHDPNAETNERVGWTHTHNLASDDVPGAVNEMLWTVRDAELLKQEAGIRAGGRASENPVKHLSLNWSPEDDPSREAMIETGQSFLTHMKWQDHQAVMVAHDDKDYAHIHIMINAIHPETGLHLDDGFEKRRAQKWAAEYEREQGKIYCEQRLLEPNEREKSPPRNMWMEFRENQTEFENEDKARALQAEKILADEKNPKNEEWKTLKDFQRRERDEFYADGKMQFSELRTSIYGEIREEFRERWGDYYAARETGSDPDHLTGLKAQLVADQKEALESRRKEACAELRDGRDEMYRGILEDQRQTRAELRGRQDEGWDNTGFFEALEARSAAFDRAAEFRQAARDVTTQEPDRDRSAAWDFEDDTSNSHDMRGNGPADLAEDVGMQVGKGAMSLFDILFRAVDGGAAPAQGQKERKSDERAAAAETTQREQRERDVADDEWRRRNQRSIMWE